LMRYSILGATLGFACLVLMCSATPSFSQSDPTKLPAPASGPGPGPGTVVRNGVDIYPPAPTLTITGDNEVIEPGLKTFALDGAAHVFGGDELDLYADHISGDGPLGILDASGNVRLREFDATIDARALHLDSYKQSGLIADCVLIRPPFVIISRLVSVDKDTMVASDSSVTTCPPGVFPLYRIVARRAVIDQGARRVTFKHAVVYLGHTKLITVTNFSRSYRTSSQGGATTDPLRQRVGYDSQDGLYVSLLTALETHGIPIQVRTVLSQYGLRGSGAATEVTLIPEKSVAPLPSSQTLSVFRTLRQLAEPPGLPAPEDDPLKFHNFVAPSAFDSINSQPLHSLLVTAGADAILNQRLVGRTVSNLEITREPEVNITATLPFGPRRPDLPTLDDPVGLREALRKPDFVARLISQYGYYDELPTHESASRVALVGSVESRPMLIGHNTLIHPMIDYTANQYGDYNADYRYIQFDMAVEHVFSNRTAIGAEYIRSFQSGMSPFDFDTLDVAHELDLSGQFGNRKYIAGARFQLDVDHGDLYDYQITVGPNLGCIIPTLGYDKRSTSLDLGINLSGLNF